MDDETNERIRMTRVRRSKEEARAAYDRMSPWYDALAGSSEAAYVDAGLRKLEAEEGERILEIGFGTGRALVSLARSVGRAGRVYGVDLSEGMARQAKRRLQDTGLAEEVTLVRGDGARLPLQDGSLDGAFLSFTLELFDTPRIRQVLDACGRVLKAGGRLCVVSLAKRGEGSLSVRLYEWVHNRMPRYVDCRPIPVEQVVKEAGFAIIEVEQRSMWTLPVDIVLARRALDPRVASERRDTGKR